MPQRAMRRFFQSTGPASDGSLVLDEAESRHAAQVLRIGTGDQAIVLDGRGGEHHCTAVNVSRREVRLRVDQSGQHPPPPVRVRLVQALTKGKSFELILQKAVELGVSEIQPLITDRVVARPEPKEFPAKVEKWRQLTIEAIKQCGAVWLPQVREPCPVSAALAAGKGLQLVADLRAGARHPGEVLGEVAGARRNLGEVSVWIGPEGDFTGEELAALIGAGVVPITLGDTVLRSETAALYALSMLRYELSRPS